MVNEIQIRNLSTNLVITLNRTSASYILDDNSPDWGTVDASDITYPLLSSNIGVGVTKTSMTVPRPISIIGWVYNDDNGTIESKKSQLNSFCNPFDKIRVSSGDYEIEGHFTQPVVYSTEDRYNNDCICKFILYITCPFPLFNKSEERSGQNGGDFVGNFIFPLVLPEQSTYTFGYRIETDGIRIINAGTVATGMIMEIKTINSVQGLSFTLGEQTLKLKSNYTLYPDTTILINTVAGSRGIWSKTSNGEYQPAWSIFDFSSDWLQVPVGANLIEIDCDEGSVSNVEATVFLKELFYAMEEQ